MPGGLDEGFLALGPERTSEAALSAATGLGCEHAEVRVVRVRSQVLKLRDGELETSLDDVDLGTGIRVLRAGSPGFAATVELGPDQGAGLATDAVAIADLCSSAVRSRVELAPEPAHGRVTWVSAHERDPAEVSLSEKIELLSSWSSRLMGQPGVDHVTASMLCVVEDSHLATLGGTVAYQRRVRVHGVVEALSVDPMTGEFETMRTLSAPAGRGFEHLTSGGIEAEIDELGEHLAAKRRAPSVAPGLYDLVIDPSNLFLTIHESIGHATELDRALGYEAALAGTSFATFDKLGTLRYGSEVMNVRGDRTTPHGLATVAIDDEGVEAQSFDIISGGLLVGYQLDRRVAAEKGFDRSNGCAFADSATSTPLQRMANVSLLAAPEDGPTTADLVSRVDSGIYVVGDKSWSIDMQRHNFQFTGQRFFTIEKGELKGQVKDVAYQARTTDFWGSLEAVGGESTYRLGGAFNCGKGQPMQAAPVSHGCPTGLFRKVNVLNARAESGR